MKVKQSIRVSSEELKLIKKAIKKNKISQQFFLEELVKELEIDFKESKAFLKTEREIYKNKIKRSLITISNSIKTQDISASSLKKSLVELEDFLDSCNEAFIKVDKGVSSSKKQRKNGKRDRQVVFRLEVEESEKFKDISKQLNISKREILLLALEKKGKIDFISKDLTDFLFEVLANLGRLQGNLVTLKKVKNNKEQLDRITEKSKKTRKLIREFINFLDHMAFIRR